MQRKWLILSAVSLGSLMSTLDGSIVNIALPAIQQDFGIDLTTVEWVVVAYLLVLGSLLLPVGRLGEVQTFKRVYLAGFAIFTVASVLCGAAPSEGALIAFRVVQAVGAAMIMAMGPAIIARTFHAGERGRALGLNGMSVSLGLSLGPVLGGILTQAASWRAIFLINVPIGILAIVWAARVLPDETPGTGKTFDLRGAALSGGALFALLLALSEGQAWGWTSPATLGLVAVFIVLGAAFVMAERASEQPLIDLALFRIRPFAAGLASVVVAFCGIFTATFLLPFLLIAGGRVLTGGGRAAAHVGPALDGAGRAVQRGRVGPVGTQHPGEHRDGRDRAGAAEPDPAARRLHPAGPRLAARAARRGQGPVHEPQQQRRAGLRAGEARGDGVGRPGADARDGPGARDRALGGRGRDAAPRLPRRRGRHAVGRAAERGPGRRDRGRLRGGGGRVLDRHRDEPHPRRRAPGDPGAGLERHPS